jgi:flagellar basal-body rod protein FlgG
MLRSLYTAATGMDAQQLQMDLIANNLANTATTGYKAARPEFEDLYTEQIRAPGGVPSVNGGPPAPLEVGLGVRTGATTRSLAQGQMVTTQNPLDLAIQGTGYFRIQLANGDVGYTRAGNFAVDASGRLSTQDGLLLDPTITVPSGTTSVTIAANGAVTATVTGREQPQTLGTIELAMFTNPGGLTAMGGNLMSATAASGEPVVVKPGDQGSGSLLQGSLESSNVQAVQEMVNMISSQRSYELSSKVISAADQMLQDLTQLR